MKMRGDGTRLASELSKLGRWGRHLRTREKGGEEGAPLSLVGKEGKEA